MQNKYENLPLRNYFQALIKNVFLLYKHALANQSPEYKILEQNKPSRDVTGPKNVARTCVYQAGARDRAAYTPIVVIQW